MRTLVLLLFGGSLVLPLSLEAQQEVEATLTGRLLFGGAPADSGTVVLHLVNPEVASALDSVRVQEDGSFTLPLPRLPIPGSGEVYFVSARRNDILYLGRVIGEPAALDSIYLIETFPATSAPMQGIQFPVGLREIWIEEGPLGWRFTDAFYLNNQASETFVSSGLDGLVWSYPLPEGALGVRVLDAGIAPGEIWASDATLFLRKPVVPGTNRIVVQYDLASLDVDLELPGEVELMRVVIPEPTPTIRVEGLARMEPTEVEPGMFVSYWAGESLQGQRVLIRSGSGGPDVPIVVWFSLALALLLTAGGIWGVRRREVAPVRIGTGRSRSAILLDIARLDESHRGGGVEGYSSRRATLLQELEGSR